MEPGGLTHSAADKLAGIGAYVSESSEEGSAPGVDVVGLADPVIVGPATDRRGTLRARPSRAAQPAS